MKTAAHRHAAALVESLQEAIGLLSKGYHLLGSRIHMSTVQSTLAYGSLYTRRRESISRCCISQLLTSSSYSTYRSSLKDNNESRFQNLNKRKIVPHSDPPSAGDVNLLNDFIDQSHKLMVLTGAGISTESGIPDYRSPNGAYSTGFKPITHQEFVRSIRARRRYWARSYAGWIRFISAQPNAAHHALSSLEKIGRIYYMVTQNVDRLHHRAGSNPLELHGTVYTVVCLECGNSINRDSFQDRVKSLNPKVVFFGDNVPKERADKAREAARECDSFLVIGSSVMTMSAFRLVRAAHEAGAPVAVVNIGETRADDFVSLKINARCGEILPRVLQMGSLSVPHIR
ncbi:NAD-dependent protein deacylase SRT2 isoform X2 [Curcuma longa]|uniref:NAD-dependent protein deacylase SRT2 isoform X2 n=1 Tax=Curcuma longa TaxID=136217 RepID=UPI003D9DEE0B